MYEGDFQTATDFAEHWCNNVDELKNLPAWVEVNYETIWESKLSKDYFEIDCDMVNTLMDTYLKRRLTNGH